MPTALILRALVAVVHSLVTADVLVEGMTPWPRYSRHFIDLLGPAAAQGVW